MLDGEIEEFMISQKRQDDFVLIRNIIDSFELPAVPKNTLAAARSLLPQAQQQYRGPDKGADGISGTIDDALDVIKTKKCAECGDAFDREIMQRYIYNDVKVNVCNNCAEILEKEGHREPKLLSQVKKSK